MAATADVEVPSVDAIRDPVSSARAGGLRYVSDEKPGISRVPHGKGFRYVAADGSAVRDVRVLQRIRTLAIPPAWTDVWICPLENGHLQATGRDAKGRKQYRYHPRWREVRDESKYSRMLAFGQALPAIRARVGADLARPGLPREKVLAVVVRLLEATFIRVGNEEYAKANRSFGLTTLRDRHVEVEGPQIRFKFRAKSGKIQEISVNDRRLARLVKHCQDIPGQELFQYIDDDGTRETIDSGDVNDYVKESTGEDFTAKDFRTWAGTVLAYRALRALQPAGSATQARKNVVEAIKEVAVRLGNTAAVARKSYVHPAVLEAYLEGTVGDALAAAAEEQQTPPPTPSPEEEAEVLDLLTQRVAVAAHVQPFGNGVQVAADAGSASRSIPEEPRPEPAATASSAA